jgi:hypothetical protein
VFLQLSKYSHSARLNYFQLQHNSTVCLQRRADPQGTAPINMATSGLATREIVVSLWTVWMAEDMCSIVLKDWPSIRTPTAVIGQTKLNLVMLKVSVLLSYSAQMLLCLLLPPSSGWSVTLCSDIVRYQHFGGPYRLHLEGEYRIRLRVRPVPAGSSYRWYGNREIVSKVVI